MEFPLTSEFNSLSKLQQTSAFGCPIESITTKKLFPKSSLLTV